MTLNLPTRGGRPVLAACLLAALGARTAGATSPEAQAWLDAARLPGAQALAMGGALTALGEDWTAAWHNPAALAWQRRAELNLGYEMGAERLEQTGSLDGRSRSSRADRSLFSHLGYAQPVPAVRGGLCWGIGWARLADFDQDGSFPDRDWTVANQRRGHHDAWLLSGALQLADGLAGGASLALHQAELDASERETNTAEAYTWRALDQLEMSGVSLRLGLQQRVGSAQFGLLLEPAHRLGVDWTHQERSGVPGQTLDDGAAYGSSYDLRIPTLVGLGAAWRKRFWQVGVAWEWQDWGALEYDNLPDGLDLELSQDLLSQAFQPRHRLSLGGETYLPGTDLRLRAGLWAMGEGRSGTRLMLYDSEGQAYSAWDWDVDTPRRGVSLGLGWLLQETVALDLAIAHERWALTTLEYGDSETRLRRSDEISRWRAQLAMTVRM